MATTYTVGDNTPDISAVLSDANGLKDLTGATVQFRIKGKKVGPRVTGNCTVDPDQVGNRGKVTYTLAIHDLDVADTYNVEYYVVYAGGRDQTFVGDGPLKVRAQSTA